MAQGGWTQQHRSWPRPDPQPFPFAQTGVCLGIRGGHTGVWFGIRVSGLANGCPLAQTGMTSQASITASPVMTGRNPQERLRRT